MLLLSARIARKAYASPAGARVVIAGLTLTVEEQEIVAIIGASGSGKTTLLRIIAGIDRDFDGRLDWRGGSAPRIGMVFQEPRLLPWCSVIDNLRLVARPSTRAEANDALILRLGLQNDRERLAAHLSLGMARRLAIARAFVIEPELMLLDEPLVSLDEASANSAREALLEVWRMRPTAALLITHQLLDAAALADRILVLAGAPATIAHEFVVPVDQRRAGPQAAEASLAMLRASLRVPEPC